MNKLLLIDHGYVILEGNKFVMEEGKILFEPSRKNCMVYIDKILDGKLEDYQIIKVRRIWETEAE